MKYAIVVLVACLVCACTKSEPVQLNVKASDFCEISGKISWVPEDTKPTIKEIRQHNAAYDSRCGIKGRPTS